MIGPTRSEAKLHCLNFGLRTNFSDGVSLFMQEFAKHSSGLYDRVSKTSKNSMDIPEARMINPGRTCVRAPPRGTRMI